MIAIRRIWRPYRTCCKCVTTSLDLRSSQIVSFSKRYNLNPPRPLEVSKDDTKPDISKTGNSGKVLLETRPGTEAGTDSSAVKKEDKDALLSVLSQLMTNKKKMVEAKVTFNYKGYLISFK